MRTTLTLLALALAACGGTTASGKVTVETAQCVQQDGGQPTATVSVPDGFDLASGGVVTVNYCNAKYTERSAGACSSLPKDGCVEAPDMPLISSGKAILDCRTDTLVASCEVTPTSVVFRFEQ